MALPHTYSLTEVQAEQMRRDFRRFARESWPTVDKAPLVWGWAMDALCDHLAYISMGDIRFFVCNMPPRLSKSTLAAVMWPVWDWLEWPERQWLTASYALQLSQRDCLKSRRLIESPWFQERFGHQFNFAFDEKLKKQYSNSLGGRRIATSTDSANTGEGGNIILVDDPHNVQEVESDVIRKNTHKWFSSTLQTRMNDQTASAWAVMGQRSGVDDLFKYIKENFDSQDVVWLTLQNEFTKDRKSTIYLPGTQEKIFEDPRKHEGDLLVPNRIDAKATRRLKKTMRGAYQLQFQQEESGSGNGTITKEQWKKWDSETCDVDLLIQVWDTAMSEEQKKNSDFSARQDWGIFRHSEVKHVPTKDQWGDIMLDDEGRPITHTVKLPERNCCILLGAWKGRVGFPDLRRKAKNDFIRDKPDYVLVEKKVSGISLIQEFRRAGIQNIRAISIDHGGRTKIDLSERLELVSIMFDDGLVYYMDTPAVNAAIDECCAFPSADHDDHVSCMTMGVQYARRRGELALWEDERDSGEIRVFHRRKAVYA